MGLASKLSGIRARARRRRMVRRLGVTPRGDLVTLGTRYGGWTLPTAGLSADAVCYLIGVGEDISFDLALIERFGCTVHAFDPVPRAASHVERAAAGEPRLVFHPIGIWTQDTTLRFHPPERSEYVSHSATNIKGTEDAVEFPVRSLRSLMSEQGHTRLDLLKVSAEGSEYAIVDSVLDDGIDVRTLTVEWAQPAPLEPIEASCRRVLDAGYALVAADRWKFAFRREGGA